MKVYCSIRVAYEMTKKMEPKLDNIDFGEEILDQKELMQKIEKHLNDNGGLK